MVDILARGIPDNVFRDYEAHARATGRTLDEVVRDVLTGRQTVPARQRVSREDLIALTRRNLARFNGGLPAMARAEFREGMEE